MATVQFRTDEVTKKQCSVLFNQLGLSMTDAINIFLRQTILHGGLPFDVKVPRYNAETLVALDDMEKSKALNIRGKDVKTILKELKAD
jgi:DNA-damage-inducible protein J